MNWLSARLGEASTWGGIGSFFGAAGLAVVGVNMHDPSIWLTAIAAGCGGVVAFIRKENSSGSTSS